MTEPVTHLYWGYAKPRLLKGLLTGVALCGLRGVSKNDATGSVEDSFGGPGRKP